MRASSDNSLRPVETWDWLCQVALAGLTYEWHNKLAGRNMQAARLLNQRPRIEFKDGTVIESWWDKRTRSWVTQWGLPGGDKSDYNGTSCDAAVSHFWAVAGQILGGIERHHGPEPQLLTVHCSLGKGFPAIVAEEVPDELVTRFLRAVEDPSKYSIASDISPEETLSGQEWLDELI